MLHTAFLALAFQGQIVDDRTMPTGQVLAPAGHVLEIPGARPVDMRLSPDGTTLFVKDQGSLRVIDASSMTERAKVASPGGASIWGMDVSRDGKRVFLTNGESKLHEFTSDAGGWKLKRSIILAGPKGKGNSFPCGIRVAANGRTAYVCLSLNNTLGIVDLSTGKVVREIDTGIAPYDVEVSSDGKTAYVSNQGGMKPRKGQLTATSAGTPTPIDERGVALGGSVSIVDLSRRRATEVAVGLQPTDIVLLPKFAVVANANSDTVTWIDRAKKTRVKEIIVRADSRLPFGSMPNALALSSDGKRLFAALAGNNAVALIDDPSGKPKLVGFVPTGWYPTAVQVRGGDLFVANNKGVGSRTPDPKNPGRNSYDYRATVQKVGQPKPAELATMTAKVKELAFVPQILRAYERQVRSTAKPVPIPKKLGDPSVFEHVVYVIKENRTYDQMFGDIKGADGDPKLCTFPEVNSPNHHAIARRFVLLDNYYCNGVLSADGHSWATEGNVTPYLDRAFGGFNRSYTFGDDPITYSSTGFIWDRVLAAGLSFRNYGEMDYAEPAKKMSYKEILAAHNKGERVEFKQKIGIDRLRRYSAPGFPGWNMGIPDVLRMDRFLEEFREFEKNGRFPNFTIVYLPQDHTGGEVSARAHIADNDLAVGRLIEALSKSRFWPKTAVFINEDDPQGGFDHVDGHRSICLVVSPYTKRGAVVKNFYNQTSVVRTMLHILGLPPLNQRDASSPLMTACFTDQADLTPYQAIPANFSLDDSDRAADNSAKGRYWASVKKKLVGSKPDMGDADEDDQMNRMLWYEMKGNAPYPAKFAGAHGKGLAKKKLKLVGGEKDEDD